MPEVTLATGGSGSGIASPAGASGSRTSPLAIATACAVAMPSGATSLADGGTTAWPFVVDPFACTPPSPTAALVSAVLVAVGPNAGRAATGAITPACRASK